MEKLCQRCGVFPAEHQEVGWVPICKACNDEISKLPFREAMDARQGEWDKFISSGCGV